MSALVYTATTGLDLTGSEVGVWCCETTPGAATGAGAGIDLSATGIDLDVTGTLTKTAVAVGAALTAYSGFTAANYLSRAYGADLDITDEVTLLAWVKPASLTGSQALCGNRTTGSGDYGGYGLNIEAGKLRLSVTDNAGTSVHAADVSDISLTNYTFAAATMTVAGVLSLYKNGTLTSTNTGGAIGATAGLFKLGVELVSGSMANAYSGSIAAVRVINGVLTAAQILNIYNNEKSLFEKYATLQQIGTEYSLDVVLEQADDSREIDSTAVRSLGGQQETIERNRDTMLAVTIGSIARVPVAGELTAKQVITEFMESVQGGETFSLDVYGSVAVPDQPKNYIADPGYRFNRNGNNLFTTSLNLREV